MAVLLFFLGHWISSVFFQTFFLHRYGAHKQFTMSKRWERFFHVCTYLTQGSSFLSARGYAILHRMHHAYSDGPKDPHSPQNHTNALTMMWATKKKYDSYAYRRDLPEPRFETWFLEGRLVPGTHYVQVAPDGSDVEEKLEHYTRATDEAEWILHNAHAHVAQFLDPRREDLALLLVLLKYFTDSGQIDPCVVPRTVLGY